MVLYILHSKEMFGFEQFGMLDKDGNNRQNKKEKKRKKTLAE